MNDVGKFPKLSEALTTCVTTLKKHSIIERKNEFKQCSNTERFFKKKVAPAEREVTYG